MLEESSGLDSSWLSTFQDTRWPVLLLSTLRAAVECASAVLSGRNVLISGSAAGGHADAVLSSLIQVVCDPHRRTKRGFNALIRHEWESMGFPFLEGHLTPKTGKAESQHALFLLFLDAVHQIMVQYPLSFEFTADYLVHVWRSSLAGLYGTFIFNSHKVQSSSTVTVVTAAANTNTTTTAYSATIAAGAATITTTSAAAAAAAAAAATTTNC